MTSRPPTMSARGIGVIVVIAMFCTMGFACESEPKSPAVERAEMEASSRPDLVLATILHELADRLEGDDMDTVIPTVREYLRENSGRIDSTVKEIEKAKLELSNEERERQIQDASPVLEEAMLRFAQAQQAFRDRASEAQKVELSEVLSSASFNDSK